jgi:cell division septum initiation protein DivIVA
MDILKLLNELEHLIETQKTLGMGIAFNFHPDDYLDITNKIRASLPEDVKRASRLTAESDKIVDGAREAAEQTLEDATLEADEIVRESRINAERMLREAEAQSNKMTLSAEATSKQTVDDSRQRAEKMLADAHQQSEKMVTDARQRAEKMLAEAHQQSELMVSQSEVVRLATAQAHEIVAAAEYETQSMRHGADEYAHGVMTDLEKQVGELMATIQRGRLKLDGRVAAIPSPRNSNGNGRTPELAATRR